MAARGGNGGDAVGGAISNRGDSWTVLTSCTLQNNRAIAGNGGDAGAGGTAGKGGNAYGGALSGFRFGTMMGQRGGSIVDCSIVANAAIGGNGGNAGAGGNAGNGGNASGGGFDTFLDFSPGLIIRCALVANTAMGGTGGTASAGGAPGSGGNAFGGGFYLSAGGASSSTYSISGSRIVRNRAIGGTGVQNGLGQGGGIYTAGPTVYLDSATRVTGNYASSGFDDLFGNVVRRQPDALLRSLAVRQV